MKQLKIAGTISGNGIINLGTKKTIYWSEFSNDAIPQIPPGSTIELTISFDEDEFISGKDGIVWATYDFRQAEIITNALSVLNINIEIMKMNFSGNEIYIMKATNEKEIEDAVDFIWKNGSGLLLKPDWSYAKEEKNRSFEKWLSGQ